jgi:hypothetical protein
MAALPSKDRAPLPRLESVKKREISPIPGLETWFLARPTCVLLILFMLLTEVSL